jgi:hypothetical protein
VVSKHKGIWFLGVLLLLFGVSLLVWRSQRQTPTHTRTSPQEYLKFEVLRSSILDQRKEHLLIPTVTNIMKMAISWAIAITALSATLILLFLKINLKEPSITFSNQQIVGDEFIVARDTLKKKKLVISPPSKESIFKLIPPPEPPVELAHVDGSETQEPDPFAFTLVDKEPMPIKIGECVQYLDLPNSDEKCLRSGSVAIRVLVDTNGLCVKSFLLRASSSCLGEAVLCLVPCFTFKPASLKGKPVQAWMTIPMYIN